MNVTVAYKGLKYIIVWGVIYFIVKYTTGDEMKEIDIALVASVLTLLLCVLETMMHTSNNHEGMTVVGEDRGQRTISGNLEIMGRMNNNVTNGPDSVTVSATNNVSVTTGDSRANSEELRNKIHIPLFDNGSMLSTITAVSEQLSAPSTMVSESSNVESDVSSTLSSSSESSSDLNSDMSSSETDQRGSVPEAIYPEQKQNVNANVGKVSQMSQGVIDVIKSAVQSVRGQPTLSNVPKTDIPNPSAPVESAKSAEVDYQIYVESENDSTASSSNSSGSSSIDDLDVEDYMGRRVYFDRNEFGGTNEQRVQNGNGQPGVFIGPNEAVTDGVRRSGNVVSQGGNNERRNNYLDRANTANVNGRLTLVKQGVNINNTGVTSDRVPREVGTINGNIVPPSTADVKKRVSPSGKPLEWYEQAFDPRSYFGAENLDQIAVSGGRTRNDILVNEMIYSDFNRLPPSFVENDFEYGYSFIPPKDWYPVPPYPPVCVSNKTIPTQPIYIDNTTMDLKDWHETQKITPPDSINTAFIVNELNSKV